jgi:hypothetical protein
VILNVASSSLITHGIYVHFEAFERRFAPDEKVRYHNMANFDFIFFNLILTFIATFCQADVKRMLWSVYHPVVDKVEWCQKGTRRLTFEQGTYRFPLHIPFPHTNIPPSISRYAPAVCRVCVSCHAQEGAYRISHPRLLTQC